MLDTLRDHIAEVLEQPQTRAIEGFSRGGAALKFGIAAADRFVGPFEKLLPVLMRHSQQFRDDCQWDFGGDIDHEVAGIAPGDLVEDLFRDRIDLMLQAAHRARSEAWLNARYSPWTGGVHIEQMAKWHFLLPRARAQPRTPAGAGHSQIDSVASLSG